MQKQNKRESKLPKAFKTFFAVSLLSLGACATTSCKLHPKCPPVDVCVMDGLGGADCVDKSQKPYKRTAGEMKNMIAFTPDDLKTQLNCAKKQCKVEEAK